MNPETLTLDELHGQAHCRIQKPSLLPDDLYRVLVSVSVLFPEILEVRVADTTPAMHQQVDSTFKPARLENGVEIMVPQFIKSGDMIRLELENLKYVDRAKGTSR
jgi:elongation factor P